LFDLDSATVAVWPISFDPVILNAFHLTTFYAVSTLNNRFYLPEAFTFFLTFSKDLLMSTS